MNFLRYAQKAGWFTEPPASMMSWTSEKQWGWIQSPYPPDTRLALAEAFDAGNETIGIYANHGAGDDGVVIYKDTNRLLRFHHKGKIAWAYMTEESLFAFARLGKPNVPALIEAYRVASEFQDEPGRSFTSCGAAGNCLKR